MPGRRNGLGAATRFLAPAVAAAVLALSSAASAGGPSQLPLRVAWVEGGELLVAERSGGERLRVEGGGSRLVPRWSPDGRRLAYWRWEGRNGAALYVDELKGPRKRADRKWSDGTVERFVAVTTAPRRLTPPLRGRALPDLAVVWPLILVWSPDGSALAFARKDGDITVVRAADGRRRTYRTARLAGQGTSFRNLAFSPDARLLAFTVPDRGAFLLDVRDGGFRRLAPRGAVLDELAWSPDGRQIAYTRGDRRGNGQLRVVELATGRAARLTNDVPLDAHAHFSNRRPVWSPDGRRVAFLSNRDSAHSYDLYVVDADGRNERRLTRGLNVRGEPRWSPDARRIAFTGWDPSIGVVSADGGRPRRLLPEPVVDGYPADYDVAWRPGRRALPVSARLPERVPVRWIRVRRDHAPRGGARLVNVRLVRHLHGQLTDLSRDGRWLAVFLRAGDSYLLLQPAVLDLATGRVTRVGRPGRTDRLSGGLLSPDGRQLFLLQGGRPRVLRVADGRELFTGPRGAEPHRWLDDGRVAYLGRRGRLVLARPGGRLERTSTWLPPVDVSRRVALDPRGRTLVYADGRCRTWLLDRASRKRRRLAAGLLPVAASFSPDGRYFALLETPYACIGSSSESDVVLFRSDGRRVATLFGVREENAADMPISWAADGRTLFVNVRDSGTRPGPTRLYAFDVARGLVTQVARGVTGRAHAGPGGWTLWLDDGWHEERGFALRLAGLRAG